ncbi:ATP-dependent DNA helicase Q-like 2 isoform X2 [Beta vulgaris subsp. vulgaris]|uniref:ATP-dependent DNA helicase Q-like 2 isoform X2 n=1 Tax=Beta vulgaris subsp. vulgaris TaxID=3555 RepID=UPI00203742E6|nr:ATP-dependent DNA helicase Q-like 2 isoform X2 [Beta vulgaris subsp. vulgaris]
MKNLDFMKRKRYVHDFFQYYFEILPESFCLDFQATATKKVQLDLMEMLHIPKCVKFVSSVNRPNLFYMVREKSSTGKLVVDEIAEFIRGSYPNNESGIVYCFSRKECEQVCEIIQENPSKEAKFGLSVELQKPCSSCCCKHGTAGRADKWQHLYAGFTVWLSES